ncbi:MAG: hypothetical protein JWQ71_1958, partial [Pedosphaera sp.]|nr:hypothetical protein [Pedosphaera sp.]
VQLLVGRNLSFDFAPGSARAQQPCPGGNRCRALDKLPTINPLIHKLVN